MKREAAREDLHVLSVDEVLDALQVDAGRGLDEREAASRASRSGPNLLASKPPRSAAAVFAAQFRSVLILVLLAAAGVAGALGNAKDALAIVAVVLLNAILGFYQEFRAERSLAALKRMLPHMARVRREGKVRNVEASTLVPGDVVLVEAGDRVPADARVIFAASLQIDESGITGESVPSEKVSDLRIALESAIGDRRNMAFMQTLVTRGRGELVVCATGLETEIGRLSKKLAELDEPPTPLQRQLDRVGKRLGVIAIAMVGVLFALALLRGEDLAHVIMESISLAVASIPEGLPAVVTITLALGMRRLARNHAIVKRMASVETLGCSTVICTDKTGTLTLNQMTARELYFDGRFFTVTGEGYAAEGEIRAESDGPPSEMNSLLIPAILCNDSRLHKGALVGDPTEGALLALAGKAGLDVGRYSRLLPRVAELPFDSAHKFMATFHREGELLHVFVKGAPEVLLKRCTRIVMNGREAALGEAERLAVLDAYHRFARRGLRGILVCSRACAARAMDLQGPLMPKVSELTVCGLIGIMDSPRPEARDAIAACKAAGIAVKMITGDHPETASAVARELGLPGRALTGADIERMVAAELAAAAESTDVFARVSPLHKLRIVQALKTRGHVIAMTGDGVNDAPALKAADIGVAMGITGTEVAKEAATMVLTDDNFASIVRAVREGRRIYDNIVKFISFQLSTTTGAMLVVFSAQLLGLPDPFTPIQILWVAMIMDGPPAVALALDAPRPGIMREPPRSPHAQLLDLGRLGKIAAFGVTMTVGTLGVLWYGLERRSSEQALTLTFTTFVLFQVFNAFNTRVSGGSAFNASFFSNPLLFASLGFVVLFQIAAIYWPPMQALLGTSALEAWDWIVAVMVASTVLLFEEARKLILMFANDRNRSVPGSPDL